MNKDPRWLRMLTITVLALLSWALIMLPIVMAIVMAVQIAHLSDTRP
jgi:hypothetical protein